MLALKTQGPECDPQNPWGGRGVWLKNGLVGKSSYYAQIGPKFESPAPILKIGHAYMCLSPQYWGVETEGSQKLAFQPA